MNRCLGCMEGYEDNSGDMSKTICPHCGYVQNTPAKEAYHLTPGSLLQDRYVVGKALGYGGFGITYIGYDALLERKVAIKEYLPTNFATRMIGQTYLTVYTGEDGEQFQAGLKSFVEEARRLMKFNDLPGTVDIYDSFNENNTGYIVMDYLEGETIKDILTKRGVFRYENAKAIILKVLDTLGEVHKGGIIHRDIAPDNIFILENNEVRLIDFGASRYETTIHSKSLSVILKPGYAPEEQYRRHGNQGTWSDVYAVAATFYKMITGVTPEESAERMMKDEVKEPSKMGLTLPPNDENAIMNAMNVTMSDRTKTAEEFARQLTADDEVQRVASTLKKYDAGKLPKWTKILASALSIIIIIGVVLIMTGVISIVDGGLVSAITRRAALSEDEVRVPSVINEQYETATGIAEESGLLLVVTDKKYSDKIEADLILSQAPLAGRILPKGGILSVVVSAGEEVEIQEGVMPDIVFRTLDEAISLLDEAGIPYEISYENSDYVQSGNVIRTSTNAGGQVAVGVTVVITVSRGSERQDAAIGARNPEQQAQQGQPIAPVTVPAEQQPSQPTQTQPAPAPEVQQPSQAVQTPPAQQPTTPTQPAVPDPTPPVAADVILSYEYGTITVRDEDGVLHAYTAGSAEYWQQISEGIQSAGTNQTLAVQRTLAANGYQWAWIVIQ